MPLLNNIPEQYALRSLNDEGLIGGYGAAFTSPSLRDKFGQYFSRNSDFGFDKFPQNVRRKGNWRHNRAGRVGDIAETRSIELRDEGLYLEIQLDPANENYQEYVDRTNRGELAISLETMPNWARYSDDGHVDYFPMVGFALTDSPTAPSGMTTVQHLRDIGVELDGDPNEQVTTILRSIADVSFPAPSAAVSYQPVTQQNRVPAAAFNGSRRLPVAPPIPAIPERHIVDPLDQFALRDQLTMANNTGLGEIRGAPQHLLKSLVHKVAVLIEEDQKLPYAQRTFLQRSPYDDNVKSDADVLAHVLGRSSAVNAYGYLRSSDFHLRDDEVDYSTLSSYGDAVVATLQAMVLYRNLRLSTKIFGLFPSFRMPSNPYNYPRVTSNVVGRRGFELADQADLTFSSSRYILQKQGRGNVTFNVLDNIEIHMFWSDALTRWASIDMVSEQSKEMEEAMRRAMDDVVLNGDESATTGNISHLGTDPTGTVYDRRLLVDGLRHACVDVAGREVDNAASALQTVDFNTMLALMGAIGLNEEVVIICDTNLAFDARVLAEVLTVDKYGDKATIRTGEVAKIFNHSIIPSEELELTNGDGMIEDSHDTTASSMLAVAPSTWMIGMGAEYSVERKRLIGMGGQMIHGYIGFDIQNFQAQGTAYSFDLP